MWQLKCLDARTLIHESWASRTWPANKFRIYICTPPPQKKKNLYKMIKKKLLKKKALVASS